MPRFMQGLLQTKASAKPADAVARATGSSPGAAYSSGLGPVGNWDIDYAVKNGVEKVIWVFRCIDVIAQSQAGIPILLRKGFDRRLGKQIQDDRLWKLLNFRTNQYERSWQTRYRLSAILQLARRGAFIEVLNGQDGRPSELHLLPPGVTEPIPDQKKFVSGYRITRGDYQIDELPPERVIWLRSKPHPTDPYAQMTPLMAAGIDVDTDWLARIFNRNFLANDGRPGVFITVDGGPGGINPDDMDELRRRFGGGPLRAGQTTVMEATGVNVQDLGANPRDVQWGELLSTSKERILLAFGVPESVMGNASGRTFDNADAERENFWMDTMVPHCDNIAAGLDPLSGDIEDDTVFGFDYDTIDVLQRQARARREEWRAELAAGVINLATYLERTGQKQIDHPAARAYILPNGIAIPGKPDDEELLKQLVPIGTPPAPDPAAAAKSGAEKGTALGMRHLNNIVASRAWKLGNGQKDALESGGSGRNQIETKAVPGAEGSIGPSKREFGKPHVYARDWQSGAGNCICGAPLRDSIHPEIAPGFPNVQKVLVGEVVEKAHPYLGLRHRLEGSIEGVLTSWDLNQEKVVCDRLMHVKSRKGTRHWDGEHVGEMKSLNPSYAVEVDRWVSELKASVEAMLTRSVRTEIRAAAGDLDNNGVIDAMYKLGKLSKKSGSAVGRLFGSGTNEAVDNVVADVMAIVDQAARNQSKRLKDTIAEMDSEGRSMKEIELAIRRSVGTRSQWRKSLATNVVTTAIEGARTAVYSKADGFVVKRWNTVGDERVRTTHRSLDGQERKATQAFKAGGSSLQYPGDPTGAPEEVINCRCFLEWSASVG